jgi:hypothetical protein
MSRKWQTVVDKIIEEARERGEFDPVELSGKKLRDDHSEVHAADKAMAHKILSNSGYAPPFIIKKREIDEGLAKERSRLRRYARRRQRLHQEARSTEDKEQAEALRQRAESDWNWVVEQFEKAIPQLNEDILLFNLMNKIPRLFKMKIRLERELERVNREQ